MTPGAGRYRPAGTSTVGSRGSWPPAGRADAGRPARSRLSAHDEAHPLPPAPGPRRLSRPSRCSPPAARPRAPSPPAPATRTSALPRVASHTTAGHCHGRLGDVSVDGDVTVPAGATCELRRHHRRGERLASGTAPACTPAASDVDGDIEGERTAVVDVADGIGRGRQPPARVRGRGDGPRQPRRRRPQLGGPARSAGSRPATPSAATSSWTATTAASACRTTRIGGDLSCQDNTPAPDGGAQHRVRRPRGPVPRPVTPRRPPRPPHPATRRTAMKHTDQHRTRRPSPRRDAPVALALLGARRGLAVVTAARRRPRRARPPARAWPRRTRPTGRRPSPRANTALAKARTDLSASQYAKAAKQLRMMKRQTRTANTAATRLIGKPPTDPESDDPPGVTAVLKVSGLDHAITMALVPLCSATRTAPRRRAAGRRD